MPGQLRFSIVINTLDRAILLDKALRSLFFLRHPNFEVIVVNGPSKDQTAKVVQNWGNWIRSADCPEANLSMSRNIGIAMARGDVVCFLDDDAQPEPDWLNQLEAVYQDPNVGAVGGYVRDHTGVNFQIRVTVCDRFGDAETYDSLEEVPDFDTSPGSWKYLSQTGCNSSFRRSALLEIGGFDEEFVYFLDETDVNLRLQDAGWKLALAPEAEVHHKYAPSAQRDVEKVPKTLYYPLRSKAYFCHKHAQKHKPLKAILKRLGRHAAEIHGYNKWYVDNDVVDQAHYEKLTNDVETGIVDGTRDARTQQAPVYMTHELSQKFSVEEFKSFRVLRPANARLKICLLSQEYPPGVIGGIGVWTNKLAEGLAARGHEVTVITKSQTGVHTVDFENGVWVHRIVPQWFPKPREPELPSIPPTIRDYCYTAYDEMLRVHLRRGLDLVSGPIWDLEPLACLSAGFLPTVVSLHTTFSLAEPFKPEWKSDKNYRRNHVLPIMDAERDLLRSAPYVLSNSSGVMKDLEALDPDLSLQDRATIVPHGIPKVPAPRAGIVPAVLGLPGRLKILFVGRMERRKGADVLLEALPSLMNQHSNIEMHFIGTDDINDGAKSMKARFEDKHHKAEWFSRIYFHGRVDDQVREDALAQCDVFVAPSRYESFGLIFIEAQRHGKACIGTNVGGIPDVIEDGETGLLVEPGSKEQLLKALELMVTDESLRTRTAANGLSRFESHFTVNRMVEEALVYYSGVISDWKSKAARQPEASFETNLQQVN